MSGNKKWVLRKSRDLIKTKFFRLRDDELELPDGRVFPHYYVFDFVDWVNVVPVTTDGRIILVKQYRHGVEDFSLEIPGGATDPRVKEDQEQAAKRELIEETGYEPGEMKHLGTQDPNPALMSNKLWSYLAVGCEKKREQNLDEFEEIEVVLATPQEVDRYVNEGAIRHAMVIAAWHWARPFIKNL